MKNTKLVRIANTKSPWLEGKIVRLSGKDGATDLIEAFNKAVEAAKADNVEGNPWDIPKKYFRDEGISLKILECETVYAEYLENTNRDIRMAFCSDCSAYDSGVCCKYGGMADGDDAPECLHWTSGVFITYDGKQVTHSPVFTELSPKEAVATILTSGDVYYSDLKEQIEEFIDNHLGDEVPNPDEYGFEED